MLLNHTYTFLTYYVRCKIKSQLTKCISPQNLHVRMFSTVKRKRFVLGIETSCDDTGAAVVDDDGNILGNSVHSQTAVSVEMGGVVPVQAKALHEKHIDRVIKEAVAEAKIKMADIDAIAVTTEPGMSMSLGVGLNHAKSLVRQHGLPMIPIHHMQAHALTARMIEQIDFPFLVLLVSGGHCLLAVARDVDDFVLLGACMDNVAPGEVFDKACRRLKLKTLPECHGMSGGAMVEHVARKGNPYAYTFQEALLSHKDCNFSFAGIKGTFNSLIDRLEQEHSIEGSRVLPNVADVCASLQFLQLRHIMKRLQRCFIFCDYMELLPECKTLVVSGGVACNQYFRAGFQNVCDNFNCRLICPPPHLCTDNGIMIAWNGMEKLKVNRGFAENPEEHRYTPRKRIGEDMRPFVKSANIKTKKILTLDHEHYF